MGKGRGAARGRMGCFRRPRGCSLECLDSELSGIDESGCDVVNVGRCDAHVELVG